MKNKISIILFCFLFSSCANKKPYVAPSYAYNDHALALAKTSQEIVENVGKRISNLKTSNASDVAVIKNDLNTVAEINGNLQTELQKNSEVLKTASVTIEKSSVEIATLNKKVDETKEKLVETNFDRRTLLLVASLFLSISAALFVWPFIGLLVPLPYKPFAAPLFFAGSGVVSYFSVSQFLKFARVFFYGK